MFWVGFVTPIEVIYTVGRSEAILISSSGGFWRKHIGVFPETKLISSDRRLCSPEGRVALGNTMILCTSFGYTSGTVHGSRSGQSRQGGFVWGTKLVLTWGFGV